MAIENKVTTKEVNYNPSSRNANAVEKCLNCQAMGKESFIHKMADGTLYCPNCRWKITPEQLKKLLES